MNCPETSCANNHVLVNDNNVQNSDSDYDNNNESNVEHEQWTHYPLRTLDDILPQVSGAKYFSKLDASSWYWTVRVLHESSLLSLSKYHLGNTATPGYRFGWITLRTSSSIDRQTFWGDNRDCFNCGWHIVYDRTSKEQNTNLKESLTSAEAQVGFKMNKDKLQIGVKEVEYCGHLFSAVGLKPVSSKVAAVLKM